LVDSFVTLECGRDISDNRTLVACMFLSCQYLHQVIFRCGRLSWLLSFFWVHVRHCMWWLHCSL